MKELKNYFKDRLKLILFQIIVFLFCGIFLFIFNVNLFVILYLGVLILFLYFIVGFVDFYFYKKQNNLLIEMKYHLPNEFLNLKFKKNFEIQLFDSLKEMFYYKEKLENEILISKNEITDYYSFWVHQIKTPISAMNILLQHIDEKFFDDEFLKFSNEMKIKIFQIEEYVEMVLSFLKMDSMGSDLKFSFYDLDKIVKSVIRKYSNIFIIRKIKLEYLKINEKVLTDEKWLQFVIEQIISNSLKYTREGMIKIYFKNGKLIIQDSGIGIDSEDIPSIFKKGFTGYNGRKHKKSSGIGLYLCKNILTKMNHDIKVESEIGKGTKMIIDLSCNEKINFNLTKM